MAIGNIHSTESFGALDGPGIRFVVFLQGCPLRCLYCHNCDTWNPADAAQRMTPQQLLEMILSYRHFIASGGVTFSGGEPLLQHAFVEEMEDLLAAEGIHVAIDTSGIMPLEQIQSCIDKCNLVLLDIKSIDATLCQTLTGASNKNALRLLDYLEQTGKPVWIRHVIVPEYTLNEEHLHQMGKYLSRFSSIERIELLAFHKLGEYKWEQMRQDYKLSGIQPPTQEEMQRAKDILRSYHLPVHE